MHGEPPKSSVPINRQHHPAAKTLQQNPTGSSYTNIANISAGTVGKSQRWLGGILRNVPHEQRYAMNIQYTQQHCMCALAHTWHCLHRYMYLESNDVLYSLDRSKHVALRNK